GSWSLLFRARRIRPPGHFVVAGLTSRRTRCITEYPGILRYPAPRFEETFVDLSRAYPGKLWKIKNLCRQRGSADYRGETQPGPSGPPTRRQEPAGGHPRSRDED